MELDQELKNLALDWAEKVYTDIYMALTNPEKAISGHELKIYEEFKVWGFFDKCPLDDEDSEFSNSPVINNKQLGKKESEDII